MLYPRHLPLSRLIWVPLLVCALARPAAADVSPAAVIQDGMVLQRGMKNPVWGTAAPGEKVVIYFNGTTTSALADGVGKWRLEIPPTRAGGPYPMTIQGNNRIDFKGVYVGDVWICSGQSNMEWSGAQSGNAAELRTQPTIDRIRLCKVGNNGSVGAWLPATAENALNFSAVGFFFGRALEADQKVPIGLIQSAVGGTAVERWMSIDRLRALGFDQVKPDWGIHHRDMIRPLQPFAIRGAIWYQGESNTGNADQYRKLFGGMIEQWRQEWGQGSFPFLYVQLARIGKPGPEVGNWPPLRQAQLETLQLPKTGMALCFDVSDGDIHPPDKRSVGERLALAARAIAYGKAVVHSGPTLRSAVRKGGDVVLTFDHAAGLQVKGGFLQELEIKSEKTDWQTITARVEGNRLVIPAAEFAGPVSVRLGWRAHPLANLYNGAGLPASPFLVEGVR